VAPEAPTGAPVTTGRSRRAGRRDRVWALAAAGAAAAGTSLVAVVDPNQPGHYPSCPIRVVTGWACPGCGALRAVHALTHGDVATALQLNAMLVLFLPVVVAAWVCVVTGRPPLLASWRRTGPVAFVLVLAWAVARNLPYEPLRALRSF